MIPIANAADYLRDLPHAILVRLPGLGHVPFEEDPATSLAPGGAVPGGRGAMNPGGHFTRPDGRYLRLHKAAMVVAARIHGQY